MRSWAVLGFVVALSPVAALAEPLERVESPVYEAPGTPQELARRAAVCIGQILKPGVVTAPTIVATDIEGGSVVANSTFDFTIRWSDYRGRSKLTFEAKPGRFRLVNTEIEALPDFGSIGWQPVSRPKKPQENGPEAVMLRISDHIAACVKSKPADW